MWFRASLSVAAAATLCVTIWMATNVSATPTILGRWSQAYAIALIGSLAIGLLLGLLAGPMYERIHAWRHNVALLLAMTCLSLTGAELVVRWLDLFGISYYADTERYHRAKLPDTDLYYVHQPNTKTDYRGFTVRINSLGMRGAEVPEKQPDEYRILFLGDSVTFGWGVEEDQTFVEQVARLLTERLGRRVRTLNSGVGSYNTDNQWQFLNRHGGQLKPDLVALVYVINDISMTPDAPFDPLAGARPRKMSPPELIAWLLGKSWTYRLFVHLATYGDQSAPVVTAEDVTVSQGWRASSDALTSISEWCLARDVPLIVYLARITADPLGDALEPALAEIGATQGFPVIDTQTWFERDKFRELINSIVDSHPNAAGHAVLAEGIANSIADLSREP